MDANEGIAASPGAPANVPSDEEQPSKGDTNNRSSRKQLYIVTAMIIITAVVFFCIGGAVEPFGGDDGNASALRGGEVAGGGDGNNQKNDTSAITTVPEVTTVAATTTTTATTLAEPVPTASPTKNPTLLPTASPTAEPPLVTAASLRIGELPGYTGWVRPSWTLADNFALQGMDGPMTAGATLTVRLVCNHPTIACDRSILYARMYGPAILPGIIENSGGEYAITFAPTDPGQYQLEVVMEMSNRPQNFRYRLADPPMPVYEGYLLPDFPMVVNIQPAAFALAPTRQCTTADVTVSRLDELPIKGQWSVTERFRTTAEVPADVRRPELLTLYDTMGFAADWFYHDCIFPTFEELQPLQVLALALNQGQLPSKPLHFLFIGDSNMARTRDEFRAFFGGVPSTANNIFVTRIATEGGLAQMFPQIMSELSALRSRDHHFFVIMNSGIHDTNLCTQPAYRTQWVGATTSDWSCQEEYRRQMEQFTNLVLSFPAIEHVYMTTFSTWPMWGVHGIPWDPINPLFYPLIGEFILEWNQVAWDVIQARSEDIPVIDAFYLTHARPDHREIVLPEPMRRAKHLHAGDEVYRVLARQFAQLCLEKIRTYSATR